MDELTPCTECNRHVRAGDDVCPFCAAPAIPAGRTRVRAGRFTRAVVFSGALIGAAALAGCGDDSGPSPDAAASSDGGGDVADAGAPDASDDVADASTEPDAFIPMPYGAPPVAKRVV